MMYQMRGENNKSDLLPAVTARKVKNMITREGMKPGERLPTEVELMNMFGVSRSTLREAMKYLKAENVIVIRQGSGTFVSDWTGVGEDPLGLHFTNQENLLYNLFEVRTLVEPQIAMLAAQRATSQNKRDLEHIVEQIKDSLINDDAAAELDILFHNSVAECTHNDVLCRVVPIINESIRRSHHETLHVAGSYERAKRSHIEIFEAIKKGDILMAKYVAERHVWETLNDIKEMEERK